MNNILNFSEFINESNIIREKPTSKKAVKLFNITWDLSDVEPDEKAEIEAKLPKKKGFTVDSNFSVAAKVPVILKKKFGYDIVDFSFNEYRIVEDIEELLYLCLGSGENRQKLFNADGKLSAFGDELQRRLISDVKKRKKLEEDGKDEFNMPKHLDEIMLGISNIYGVDWDESDIADLLKPIHDDIESRRKSMKKVASVSKFSKSHDDEEEDEETTREIDDDEVPEDVKDEDVRRRIEAEEDEEGDDDPVSEDTKIFYDEKSKRYYFGDTDWYMEEGSDGDFRVFDDGEYEGKYCGSIETLKNEDDPLNYVLNGL